MGGDEQGMALLVMKQHECPAAQDDAQTPNQPSRDKDLTVDRLAMPVYIAGQPLGTLRLCSWYMPEVGGPAGEGIREARCAIGISHLR